MLLLPPRRRDCCTPLFVPFRALLADTYAATGGLLKFDTDIICHHQNVKMKVHAYVKDASRTRLDIEILKFRLTLIRFFRFSADSDYLITHPYLVVNTPPNVKGD